jgi:hypothetical protein
MSIPVAWLVYPLVLLALALGCGRLLEVASRTRLPGALLAPAGLCLMIVVAQLFTLSNGTAELATPAVVALAVAGLVLWSPTRLRPPGWVLAAGLGTFAVYAAPVVQSGDPTFAGYVRLDDTSHWLAITDFIMGRGRDLAGLPPSGYELNIRDYLNGGYPVGSFLPLGVGHVLLDLETAWLFQPTLAFYAALMALSLYSLVSRAVESRPLRALIAFVAAQPALLFGWYLLGGIKEMGAACAIAATTALLLVGIEQKQRWGSLAPAAVASAATVAILSLGGAAWLLVPLVATLAIMLLSQERMLVLRRAGVFVAVALLLSLPSLTEASDFLGGGSREVLTGGQELGILFDPLNVLQVLGIWPANDFRVDPGELGVTYLLLGLLIVAGIVGLVIAWRRRWWGPLLYLSAAAIGCLISAAYGSPWVDSKAFAIASPAFVLIGLLGAVALARFGLRVLDASPRARLAVGAVLAVAIVGGVLWSNVLGYRGANIAPYDRLSELQDIGEQIAGKGPTLMTEPELYGVRYFLRGAEPDGVSILGRRPVYLRSGSTLPSFIERRGMLVRAFADIDRFRTQNILVFRTLVLRRSPVASRPPAAFRLRSRGKFYEVWQRPLTPARATIAHMPLGRGFQPGAKPRCSAVLGLARRARGGVLATVRRLPTTAAIAPFDPAGPATRSAAFTIPTTGRYGVWVGGAGFRRNVDVLVDGKKVDSAWHKLSPPDQYHPFGSIQLTQGAHRVVLRYGGGNLRPGSAGPGRTLGPVIFSRGTAAAPVTLVRPESARSLCPQNLDWIEALGP